MGRLTGKVAVITGAASGIGEASARLFVAEGCRVVLADVQDARGAALAAELGEAAVYQRADVALEDQVKAAIDLAVSRFGRLDALFNNAGFGGVSGPIAQTPADGFDRTIGVLLRGVFLGIKHAAPIMLAQRSGAIVSTASVAGMQAGFGPHVYSAAKAAVIQLTRTVAMELGEAGVRVNCVCPGGIATPIFAGMFGLAPEQARATVPDISGHLARMQSIPRAGQPEDIAQAVMWLCGDESSFVNGHAMVVDGGLTAGRLWSQGIENRKSMAQVMGLSL